MSADGHCKDCRDPGDCTCPCDECIRADGFRSREDYEAAMAKHREYFRRYVRKPQV